MEEKEAKDLFTYPEGYEYAKSLIEGLPEQAKDGLLYGIGRCVI